MSNRAEQLIGEIDGQITAMRPRLDVGAVTIAQMRAADTIAVYGCNYHLFAYSNAGGGGIRQTVPHEAPGSIPTVHVEDAQAAYDERWPLVQNRSGRRATRARTAA